MSKILELARKFYELSKRGVDGERQNAQKKLDEIMQAHNLTIEDIEGEEVTEHYFTFPLHLQKLLHQVAHSVLLDVKVYGITDEPNKNCMIITAAQAVEIQMKFDFYAALYESEEKIFYQAFISINKIFHPDAPVNDADDLSEEDLLEQMRVFKMKKLIESKPFYKQIGTNK